MEKIREDAEKGVELNHQAVLLDEVADFAKSKRLSDRESQILLLLVEGTIASDALAKKLGISPNTANNHIKSILDKTNSSSKTHLLSQFLQELTRQYTRCKVFANRPRVLIVDDEEGICLALQQELTAYGLRVWTETDPLKVVDLLPQLHLDFLVVDIKMPGMDGFQLLKKIRENFYPYPIVFFMTGFSQYRKEECLNEGAAAFFNKPVRAREIHAAVLEHYVDSDYLKSKILGTGLEVPVQVRKQDLTLKIENLGYGGAFIPIKEASSWAKVNVNVGDIVDFSFHLMEHAAPVPVKGEVVWKREAEPEGREEPGFGVRFIELSNEDKDLLQEQIRLHQIRSFIPDGSAPST